MGKKFVDSELLKTRESKIKNYIDTKKADKSAAFYYAKGSSSAAGNGTSGSYLSTKWEANINGVTTPTDGMRIAYRIQTNPSVSTAGAILSLDGINYYPVVYNVNTIITTRYSVGSTLLLTFNSTQTATAYLTSNKATTVTGCWQIMDYDSNTTRIYILEDYYNKHLTLNAIYRYQLCLSNGNEVFAIGNKANSTSTTKTDFSSLSFNPFDNIYYYATTATINANTITSGEYWMIKYYVCDMRYTFNNFTSSSTTSSFGTGNPVYLVATPTSNTSAKLYYGKNGTTYTSCITNSLPTEDDGLIYIYLGQMVDSYRMELSLNHPIYWFKNGSLRRYIGNDYSFSNHNHDTLYASKDHTHTKSEITDLNLSDYALATHNHDTSYADINHNHDTSYALKDHTHTGYALTTHTHSEYSPFNHSHTTSDITNFPSALKNPNALTFGDKIYDGSSAKTITTSDLINPNNKLSSSLIDGLNDNFIISFNYADEMTKTIFDNIWDNWDNVIVDFIINDSIEQHTQFLPSIRYQNNEGNTRTVIMASNSTGYLLISPGITHLKAVETLDSNGDPTYVVTSSIGSFPCGLIKDDSNSIGLYDGDMSTPYGSTITLSSVAFSGSYNDLSNTPVIPDISDKQDKITESNKLNTSLISGLSTVATSGSYTDLTNKPDIPDISTKVSQATSYHAEGYNRLYCILNGEESTIKFDYNVSEYSMVQRTRTGAISCATPTENTHSVNKEYAESNFIGKSTTSIGTNGSSSVALGGKSGYQLTITNGVTGVYISTLSNFMGMIVVASKTTAYLFGYSANISPYSSLMGIKIA